MFKFIISIFIFINLYSSIFAKGLPLSVGADTENYSWIKGRQMISINLNPGITVFTAMFSDTIFRHGLHTAGFLGVDLGISTKYLQYAENNASHQFIIHYF